MSDDKRESAAVIFDRTGSLAGVLASRMSGAASSALMGAQAVSVAVAAIIRAVGADDAATLIADLAANKTAGAITDEEIAEDDAEIENKIREAYQPTEVDGQL